MKGSKRLNAVLLGAAVLLGNEPELAAQRREQRVPVAVDRGEPTVEQQDVLRHGERRVLRRGPPERVACVGDRDRPAREHRRVERHERPHRRGDRDRLGAVEDRLDTLALLQDLARAGVVAGGVSYFFCAGGL